MSRRGGWRQSAARGVPFSGYTFSWVAKQCGLAAGIGLLAATLIYLSLLTTGLYVPFWQLWALVTVPVLTGWLVAGSLEAPLPLAPLVEDTALPPAVPFPQVSRWEQRLSVVNEDPQWYTRLVRDRIRAVVSDRLRMRHGIRLATQPEQARAMLGDPLYEFLTEPLARVPDAAELTRLLTRMEKL